MAKARTRKYSQATLEKRRIYERNRHAKLSAEQRAKLRARNRANKLRRDYGMTQADYEAMLAAQEEVCAICYDSLTHSSARPHVDHDHETGKVRGILCSACNRGIGWLKDNAEIARRAALYLKGVRDYR